MPDPKTCQSVDKALDKKVPGFPDTSTIYNKPICDEFLRSAGLGSTLTKDIVLAFKVMSKLLGVELIVLPFEAHELLVAATFGNLPAVDYKNLVGAANR